MAIIWMIRFFFGACIFSFLNVVIDRMPRGESVVKGRSHCTNCGRELTALELIPCVSFVCLRGKCKDCKSNIPVRDFFVELFGGVAFCICGMRFGFGRSQVLSIEGAVVLAYLGILVVIALIDWDTQIIYDRFHLFIALLAIASIWLFPAHGLVDRCIGFVIISVPMFLLAFFIPGAFGGGDIKLMAVSGFFLGTAPIVCAMFIGILLGGAYGAYMLITKKLERQSHFAFGPFLAAGLAIATFYGDAIANWYLQFIKI